jgi:hypothetical protein
MGEKYMCKEKMVYINIGYILSQIGQTRTIDEKNASELKCKLVKIVPNSDVGLLVIDMDNVISLYNGVEGKTSYLQSIFEDVEKQESVKSILFANCSEVNANFLREKDFPDSNKVFVLSFEYETNFLRYGKNVTNDESLEKLQDIIFGSNSVAGDKGSYLGFIAGLISVRIKAILSDNRCIENIKEKGKHILFSTPVHVNKYVNLKPVLEKNVYFQEVCYLLYRQIVNKCSTPDYIVASSRNSIYIASGLMKYFKTANMIIIDQVSPVTKLSNFSNLEDIKPQRTYAIIEDFCCMGTEIKTVKSILWSRGVDVEQDCYVFPIVSTNLYGEETSEVFKAQRIYPLYILEKSVNYLMFTQNCCPICNELNCQHSEIFNLK